MLSRIRLYAWTIRYLKPEQVFWRIAKRLGIKCTLGGIRPSKVMELQQMVALPELDFDPVFLSRFSVNELMNGRVTFLHEAEDFCWEGCWNVDNRSLLWNFNLHYFEYLHPLTAQYLETCDRKFLAKTQQMIRGWIRQNPQQQQGPGWSAYTISLRLTNWIAFLSTVGQHLEASFQKEMEESIFQQYVYLSEHLEKDVLGNHYFENLKTLVLCALFFGDRNALSSYLLAFQKECREEILPDGMHFELSPMYHKIVLEGLLRVTICLREAKIPNAELEQMAQDMLDAADTMEHGLSRTPLFNDCGNNVAKSLDALISAAKNRLGLAPVRREALAQSGYYFFENGPWRLIVDAGAVGPDYIPGHSHCDAMSFELYRNGETILVNCGTYGYQCKERYYFRSTEAHNTVQIQGVEQSEIWSAFRLARRSKTRVLDVLENGIRMEMTDYKGNCIRREILLKTDALCIIDSADGLQLLSHLHSIKDLELNSNAQISRGEAMYAPEYGQLRKIQKISASGMGSVAVEVSLR